MSDKELYAELRRKILEKSDVCCAGGAADERLYELIDEAICDYARTSHLPLAQRIRTRKQLFASIRGFGVIQELLEDRDITEIMVNGPRNIFFEKDGRLSRFEGEFEGLAQLNDIVQKIAAGANRVINEASPIVDARLGEDKKSLRRYINYKFIYVLQGASR
jgi:pilus assembly protein CpaF